MDACERTYQICLPPPNTDHLSTIAEQAGTLNESANTFVEYGKTQEKLDQLDQLRDKLEIRAS